MAIIKEKTVLAPSSWGPYLVNGDCSGMSDEDVRHADLLIASEEGWHFTGASEATDFQWAPSAGGVFADCSRYTLIRTQALALSS
jgi:hypothetical protein